MTNVFVVCNQGACFSYCSVSVVVWATSVYGLQCSSGLGARQNWCHNISVLCVGRSFRILPFLRGLWRSSMSLDLALHLKYRRRHFPSHWMGGNDSGLGSGGGGEVWGGVVDWTGEVW